MNRYIIHCEKRKIGPPHNEQRIGCSAVTEIELAGPEIREDVLACAKCGLGFPFVKLETIWGEQTGGVLAAVIPDQEAGHEQAAPAAGGASPATAQVATKTEEPRSRAKALRQNQGSLF